MIKAHICWDLLYLIPCKQSISWTGSFGISHYKHSAWNCADTFNSSILVLFIRPIRNVSIIVKSSTTLKCMTCWIQWHPVFAWYLIRISQTFQSADSMTAMNDLSIIHHKPAGAGLHWSIISWWCTTWFPGPFYRCQEVHSLWIYPWHVVLFLFLQKVPQIAPLWPLDLLKPIPCVLWGFLSGSQLQLLPRNELEVFSDRAPLSEWNTLQDVCHIEDKLVYCNYDQDPFFLSRRLPGRSVASRGTHCYLEWVKYGKSITCFSYRH